MRRITSQTASMFKFNERAMYTASACVARRDDMGIGFCYCKSLRSDDESRSIGRGFMQIKTAMTSSEYDA